MYNLYHVTCQGGRLQEKMFHAKISMKYKTVTFKRDKTFTQPRGQNDGHSGVSKWLCEGWYRELLFADNFKNEHFTFATQIKEHFLRTKVFIDVLILRPNYRSGVPPTTSEEKRKQNR